MQWRELLKNNSAILLITTVGFFLNYSLNVYLARTFSPEVYGDFFITMRILIIVLPLSLLGTSSASNRFLSQYHTKDLPRFLGFYRWTLTIFKISTLSVWIIAVLMLISVIVLTDYKITVFEDYHLATFAFWIVPLIALSTLQSAFLQSIQSYKKSIILSLLYPVVMITGLFLLHYLIPTLNYFHLLVLVGLSYMVIILAQRLYITKNIKKIVTEAKPDFSPKKQWLRISLGMMLNSFIGLCLANVYLLMLELVGHNENEIGYFSAIFTISGILMIIGASVNYIINPLISPLLDQKKMSELFKLLLKAFYIELILGSIVLTILILFGRQLLGHFGSVYVAFYPEMLIVSCVMFIYILIGVAGSLLLYSDRQAILNWIFAGELVFAITLCLLLIPKYELMGAILSMTISLTLSCITTALIATYIFLKKPNVDAST